jgi:hypothetical protein
MAMSPVSSGSAQYGAQVGDYPGNPIRYIAIVIGVIALFMGVTGDALGGLQWDTSSRWILAFFGIVLFVAFYLKLRGAHARLFERGFVIARAGKETSGSWPDIVRMTRQAKQWRLLYFIPIPGTISHEYTVYLRSGDKFDITGEYFTNSQKMADEIQQRWRQAQAASASPPAS